MGYTPLALQRFNVEHAADGFNGTLYSMSGYRGIKPDVIDYYHLKSQDNLKRLVIGGGSGGQSFGSIYFRDWLSKKDKYSSFFNGNKPLETVYSKAEGGRKLLVFKDSYAHSLVPFLMNHYSEITMIDLRYLSRQVNEVVDVKSYDQILFIYNADTFNTDKSIQNACW